VVKKVNFACLDTPINKSNTTHAAKTKIETTAGNVMTKMAKKDYIDYTLNVLVSFGVAVDSAIGFLNRL
jgi:hypothetical protein